MKVNNVIPNSIGNLKKQINLNDQNSKFETDVIHFSFGIYSLKFGIYLFFGICIL